MALDSDNVLTAIYDILVRNTSTLATSLTSSDSINYVDIGDRELVPTEITRYPAILVDLTGESEQFQQLGQRNNLHILEFSIWPLVYMTDRKKAAQDCRKLVQNIKSLLKTNITLSGTAMWSLPEIVEYSIGGGTFNAGARIILRTRHLST